MILPFLNYFLSYQDFILSFWFVQLIQLDHFIASLAANEPIQLLTKFLFLPFLLFLLIFKHILKCVSEFDLSLWVGLIKVLEEPALTTPKVNSFLSFQFKYPVKLKVVDCSGVKVRCSFLEFFPTGQIVIFFILLIEFFVFPLVLLLVKFFWLYALRWHWMFRHNSITKPKNKYPLPLSGKGRIN